METMIERVAKAIMCGNLHPDDHAAIDEHWERWPAQASRCRRQARLAIEAVQAPMAKALWEALRAQEGDGLGTDVSDGFGYAEADHGRTILDGAYDLEAALNTALTATKAEQPPA